MSLVPAVQCFHHVVHASRVETQLTTNHHKQLWLAVASFDALHACHPPPSAVVGPPLQTNVAASVNAKHGTPQTELHAPVAYTCKSFINGNKS